MLAAGGAFAVSYAQRSLSTPARLIRRRSRDVEGAIVLDDGSMEPITERSLLAPLERALPRAVLGDGRVRRRLRRHPAHVSEQS